MNRSDRDATLDPARAPAPVCELACPRCGAPNACAPAVRGDFATPCWCTSVTIAPEILATLPAGQRGRACLCRSCATAGASRTEVA